jgi:serine/threonine protein phosphatase 1
MIAVIGDIHGCFYTLKDLVSNIKVKYPDIEIYCVGDLVDRGNFSYEVIEFIKAENIKFTVGNHDLMFYHFVHHPNSEMGRIWIYNGSEPTVDSYKDKVDEMHKHLELIIKTPLFYDLQDCFISHAGISSYFKSRLPRKVLSNVAQINKIMNENIMNDHGILWARDSLMDIGKLQVVGHTRQREVYHNKKNNVAYIDTSAYTGNKLSSIIVKNNEIVDILDVLTYKRDIE